MTRYPLRIRDWIRARWAVHPKSCEKCGARVSVAWALTVSAEHWLRTCTACNPDIHRLTVKGAGILVQIAEVPALTGQGGALGVDAPDLRIQVATGHTIVAGLLHYVAESFTGLAEARIWRAKNPGDWALERREDGRVWAPWNPRADLWSRGAAMPLRTTVLRDARSKRKCFDCKEPLESGASAWRPDDDHWHRECTRGHHGWSRPGLACLWCPPCVAGVIARADAEADEVVVGHLRVIEGSRMEVTDAG